MTKSVRATRSTAVQRVCSHLVPPPLLLPPSLALAPPWARWRGVGRTAAEEAAVVVEVQHAARAHAAVVGRDLRRVPHLGAVCRKMNALSVATGTVLMH